MFGAIVSLLRLLASDASPRPSCVCVCVRACGGGGLSLLGATSSSRVDFTIATASFLCLLGVSRQSLTCTQNKLNRTVVVPNCSVFSCKKKKSGCCFQKNKTNKKASLTRMPFTQPFTIPHDLQYWWIWLITVGCDIVHKGNDFLRKGIDH